MKKKIVIYFSYTNNTKKIALRIKEKLNCDIFEIKTVIPYSTDYDKVVNDEQNSEASNYLPELIESNLNLEEYDTVIIGGPVWWYRYAPAIRSFVNKYDLSGKRVIPFATNAGWLGKTFIEFKNLVKNANVENEMNIVFESYSDKLKTDIDDIDKWIDNIN